MAEARYEIAVAVARNNGEDLAAFRQQFKNDPDAVLTYLRDHCPPVYDPFCGGGSIPLEAQRLGLRARASDLNPLPVLLNKAMIELPPKFHNQKPVNPDADPMGMFTGTGRRQTRVPWKGTAGLADDIRYYGASGCVKRHISGLDISTQKCSYQMEILLPLWRGSGHSQCRVPIPLVDCRCP